VARQTRPLGLVATGRFTETQYHLTGQVSEILLLENMELLLAVLKQRIKYLHIMVLKVIPE